MFKPEQLEALNEIADSIKDLDEVYGSGLFTPSANKINSSRAAMVYQHITQARNLDNPDIARTSTGYEKMFGDRGTSYLRSDRDYEVVKKIRKFNDDMVYALILREKGTNYYDIVFRYETESFAESSGVRMNNKIIDKKTPGDTIKAGEVLYRSTAYDSNMNYRLGANLKTLYLVSPIIVEDAMLVSKTGSKKLSATSVITLTIPKNGNDILLNTFGDKNNYKVFPDIGESTNSKVVCIRRRIDYNNAHYLLKNRNLRKEMAGDTTYVTPYNDVTVVDINIYSNTPFDELPKDDSHKQINHYFTLITDFWREIHDTIHEIRQDPNNTYSDNIGVYFARARDYLSIGKTVQWTMDQSTSSSFDNMIIEITVAKSSPATEGTKVVGRHGNKGVITQIVDDEFMPVDENGEVCDIIYGALSIIGRLNQSQLNEHELNWLVDEVLRWTGSKKKKFEALLVILSFCNPKQEEHVKKFFDLLPSHDKEKFLDEITTEFVTFQSASKSLTFKNYGKLVDIIKPKKKRFTIKDKDGTVGKIHNKLIMADSYVYRLKHEPITKFSVRSKGTINPRTFLPIKSHAHSRGTALFNNQAIRLGTMEFDVLRLCNDPAAINYLTRLYCTSVVGRREFHKLLNTDVFSDEVQIDMENFRSRVVDMFSVTFLTCGYQLRIDHDESQAVDHEVMPAIKSLSNSEIRIMMRPEFADFSRRND